MQVHYPKTKWGKAWRNYTYGDNHNVKPYKEKHKKTRLEVLEERRKAWEQRNGKA